MSSELMRAVVTGVLALLTAGVIALVNSWISTRAGIDENLRDQRLATYPELWQATDVIGYASTTSGYAIGSAAEVDLVGQLRELAGVPVVTSGLAARQALGAFGVRRVALVHPPWSEAEMGGLGARYFRDQEIDAVTLTATALPRRPEQVRTEQVIDYVSDQVDASAEAIFFAGNGFRAAAAIEEQERRTGQLVLEANQVLLWSILAATGTELPVDGYGRLFSTAAVRSSVLP